MAEVSTCLIYSEAVVPGMILCRPGTFTPLGTATRTTLNEDHTVTVYTDDGTRTVLRSGSVARVLRPLHWTQRLRVLERVARAGDYMGWDESLAYRPRYWLRRGWLVNANGSRYISRSTLFRRSDELMGIRQLNPKMKTGPGSGKRKAA